MTKKTVEWFVSCSVEANEIVSQYLGAQGITEAEAACRNALCTDGKRRNVWRISVTHIKDFRSMLKSFPHAKLHFFKRSSFGGKLSEAKFLLKKRSKKPKQVLEVVM